MLYGSCCRRGFVVFVSLLFSLSAGATGQERTTTDDAAPDSARLEEVSSYPAQSADLASYGLASDSLSQLRAPVLFKSANPHDRLFLAAFDCSWDNVVGGPKHRSNVWEIIRQVRARSSGDGYIRSEYIVSDCTTQILLAAEHATPAPEFEAGLERMYGAFAKRTGNWLEADPEASVRVVVIGFGWGAEQAAAFSRLVHRRGTQAGNDSASNPAGRIAQAVGLFDPVGTVQHDLRLPPSVISGFQITAEHERRDLFKSVNIIDPGMTEGNHFLNVTVGGAHADIGGGYLLNGLSTRSFNLMVDYLNAVSGTPLLHKQPIPTAAEDNVVHRSEEEIPLFPREGSRQPSVRHDGRQ